VVQPLFDSRPVQPGRWALGGPDVRRAIRSISQAGPALERSFLAMIIEQGLAEQGIAISQKSWWKTLAPNLWPADGTGPPRCYRPLAIEERACTINWSTIALRRRAQTVEQR